MNCSMFVDEISASLPLFFNITQIIISIFNSLVVFFLELILNLKRVSISTSRFVKSVLRGSRSTSLILFICFILIFLKLGCIWSQKTIKIFIPSNRTFRSSYFILSLMLDNIRKHSLQIFGQFNFLVIIRIVPLFYAGQITLLELLLDERCDLQQEI